MVDGRLVSTSILPRPDAVRAARHEVRDRLRALGLNELEGTACLLVGELLTNVVLHSRTAADLVVVWDGACLHVEVHDLEATLPVPREPSGTSLSGRGLRIVTAMADRWGIRREAVGKVVWFELDRRSDAGN